MARFGTDRPEGGVWRGVLLRATEGASVQVVAAGTVVYANWLRGFGNLIIVDHGQQYLSVYAYNQSLLKQVGDTVKTGETIALAGSTGGQVDSALYFEVRHRGSAVDPVKLLAR
jgi:septal ring factor EnvC (AmiA/AmiB activator)